MTTPRYLPPTLAGALLGLAFAAALPATGDAHKAITSKYSYNEDMFPLFRDRCGACHVEGGVAPMSLLTYDDAAPWGESLRLELLGEEPPKPWHALTLSARELDMILVWANGGSPRGDVAKAPPPMTVKNEWAAGPPDVALTMAAPFVLAGSVNEATFEAALPVGAASGSELAAVDLKPGLPAIVRNAALSLRTADGATRPLGSWLPGQLSSVALKTPVRLPAGAAIVARIDYRRTWKYEGQVLEDASTVGLYFARPAAARATRPPRR